jgi:hypothetical protein
LAQRERLFPLVESIGRLTASSEPFEDEDLLFRFR